MVSDSVSILWSTPRRTNKVLFDQTPFYVYFSYRTNAGLCCKHIKSPGYGWRWYGFWWIRKRKAFCVKIFVIISTWREKKIQMLQNQNNFQIEFHSGFKEKDETICTLHSNRWGRKGIEVIGRKHRSAKSLVNRTYRNKSEERTTPHTDEHFVHLICTFSWQQKNFSMVHLIKPSNWIVKLNSWTVFVLYIDNDVLIN